MVAVVHGQHTMIMAGSPGCLWPALCLTTCRNWPPVPPLPPPSGGRSASCSFLICPPPARATPPQTTTAGQRTVAAGCCCPPTVPGGSWGAAGHQALSDLRSVAAQASPHSRYPRFSACPATSARCPLTVPHRRLVRLNSSPPAIWRFGLGPGVTPSPPPVRPRSRSRMPTGTAYCAAAVVTITSLHHSVVVRSLPLRPPLPLVACFPSR